MGFNIDAFLQKSDHDVRDHDGVPSVGNLHSDGTGPSGTIAHSGLDHTGIPGVKAIDVRNNGTPLGTFDTLNLLGFTSVSDAGGGVLNARAKQIYTNMLNVNLGNGNTINTGSIGFTPVLALFFSGLRTDAEGGGVNDETISVGFATGTGVATSPPQQGSTVQIGGYHSSGTADRDRVSSDNRYVAAALARENTSATNPLTNHLDTSNGGGAGALRVTSYSSSGITLQCTLTGPGAPTILNGRVFVIAIG